jgi:hypothetical protein
MSGPYPPPGTGNDRAAGGGGCLGPRQRGRGVDEPPPTGGCR